MKTLVTDKHRRRQLVNLYFKYILISFLCCYVICINAFASISIPPSKMLYQISKQKNKAERFAKDLCDHYKGRTQDSNFLEAVKLYTDAESASNALIDTAKFNLDAGRKGDIYQQYNVLSKDALYRSEKFIAYVEELVYDQRSGDNFISYLVSGALEPFTDAYIKIHNYHSNVDKEKKDEIKRMLDECKWKPFNKICPR